MYFKPRIREQTLMLFLWLTLSFVENIHCAMEIVDLTHTLFNGSLYWPGNPSLQFNILARGLQDDGYWYESNSFSTSEHGGTHLDAPAHFSKGKYRVHEIPASRLVGPGVVIDIRESAESDPDYRVSVSDLQRWEGEHGPIPDGAIVMAWSGWDARYPNPTLTFNTATPTDPSTFHFPGYHPDAADWLLANRNITALGVDTPSVDFGQSKVFEVHVKVSAKNIFNLENVNNLGKVPASGSIIFAGVAKLYNGSGGPARVLALFDDNRPNSAMTVSARHPFALLVVAVAIFKLHV